MTLLALLATLVLHAPLTVPGLPAGVSYPEPGTLTLHVRRYVQSGTWRCCLWHSADAGRWRELWPRVRNEAHHAGSWWSRKAKSGEVVQLDVPPGRYRLRWCDAAGNCAPWSVWVRVE